MNFKRENVERYFLIRCVDSLVERAMFQQKNEKKKELERTAELQAIAIHQSQQTNDTTTLVLPRTECGQNFFSYDLLLYSVIVCERVKMFTRSQVLQSDKDRVVPTWTEDETYT